MKNGAISEREGNFLAGEKFFGEGKRSLAVGGPTFLTRSFIFSPVGTQ